MADVLELTLKINKEDVDSKLNETVTQINSVKSAQEQLNTMYKNGVVSQDQYRKQTALNNDTLKQLTSTQNQAVKITNSQNGSIKELGASLALNKQAYINLSKEERENSAIGGKLLQTIQSQDKEYKKLNETIGQHQPSVGNYGKVWDNVNGILGKVTVGVGAVMGAFKGFDEIIESSEYLGDKLAITMGGVNSGVNYFMKSLTTMDFSGFLTGMKDAINAGKEYAAILDDLEDRRIALSFQEADARIEYLRLTKVEKDLTKTDEERARASQEKINLENRLMKKRVEIGEEGYKALVTKVSKENKVSEDQLMKFIKQDSQFMGLLESGEKFQAKVNLRILEEGQKMLTSNLPLAIRTAKMTALAATDSPFSIFKQMAKEDPFGAQMAMILKHLNNITEEEKKQISSSYNEMQGAVETYEQRTIKAETNISKTVNNENKEKVKDSKDSQKEIQKQNEETAKAMVDSFFNELDQYEKINEKKLENTRQFNEQLNALIDENYINSFDTDEERRQAEIERDRQRFEEDLQTKLDNEIYTQEQVNSLKLAYQQKYTNDSNQIIEDSANKQKQINKEQTQAQLNAIKGTSNAVMDIASENTVAYKAAAITQTTMDTYQSATAAYKAMVGLPVIGPILAVGASIAAVTAGLFNVNKIASIGLPEKKKYATGGIVPGNSYVGDNVPAMVNSGEVILDFPKQQRLLDIADGKNNSNNSNNSKYITMEQAITLINSLKAYVVESEISDKQAERSQREIKFSVQ